MASFDEVIPPGEAGYVTAKLITDKLRGSVGRGITVYTDDPNVSRTLLTVRATIRTSVIVLPHETVMFGNDLPATRSRSRVIVRKDPMESGDVRISGLETSVPWLKATATRLEEPRPAGGGLPAAVPGDWLIQLAVDAPEEYGQSQQSLRFRTGLERQPEVRLPVIVRLRPPVHVNPMKLELPPATDGEPSTATLLVAVRRGLDAELLEFEAMPPTLGVELEPTGGRYFKAHVSWSEGDLPDGAIVFKVGSEHYRVPVVSASAGS